MSVFCLSMCTVSGYTSLILVRPRVKVQRKKNKNGSLGSWRPGGLEARMMRMRMRLLVDE